MFMSEGDKNDLNEFRDNNIKELELRISDEDDLN